LQKEKSAGNEIYIGDFIRMKAVAKYLLPAKMVGSRLLDAGCGNNIYKRLVEEKGYRWYGIDVEPTPPAVYGDIADIPHPDNYFDAIISVDVLEHVQADLKALKEFHRVLKRNGTLLVHTPNATQTHILAEFPDNPHHVRKGYRSEELNELLSQAGFSEIKIHSTFNILCCLAWEITNLTSAGRGFKIQKLLDFDPTMYRNLGWLMEVS